MSEKAALEYLRDVMATWYYLLMERYGKTTREEMLGDDKDASSAWEHFLKGLIGTADYYDREIELMADYRPKEIIRPEQVWGSIAGIKNITALNIGHIKYAQNEMEKARSEDFQRRF